MDPQTFSSALRHLAKSLAEVADILDSKNNQLEPAALANNTIPAVTTTTIVEEGKKVKQRKEKDPNAPKRPPSGYALFTKEKFEGVKNENPQLDVKDKLKLIGKMWEKADHSAYDKRAQELRQDYKERMEEYTSGKSPSSPAITAAQTESQKEIKKKPAAEAESSAEPSKKKKKTTAVADAALASSPTKNEKLISDSQSTIISTNSTITEGKKKKKSKESSSSNNQ